MGLLNDVSHECTTIRNLVYYLMDNLSHHSAAHGATNDLSNYSKSRCYATMSRSRYNFQLARVGKNSKGGYIGADQNV